MIDQKLRYSAGVNEDGDWVLTKIQPTTTDTKPLVAQTPEEQTILDRLAEPTQEPLPVFSFEQKFRRGVLFGMYALGGAYLALALTSTATNMESPPLILLSSLFMSAIALYLLEPKRFHKNGEAFRRNFEELNDAYEDKIQKMKNWRKQ